MASRTPREAAIDAVIRFVTALDEPSADLMSSSLSPDAIMDLTPFHERLGWEHCTKPVHGQEEIVRMLMNGVGTRLDTTHMATNIRCTLNNDLQHGSIECTVLAQHFRRGEGLGAKRQQDGDYFMGANRYYVKVGKVPSDETEDWRIQEVKITPLWTVGNEKVMNFSSVGESSE